MRCAITKAKTDSRAANQHKAGVRPRNCIRPLPRAMLGVQRFQSAGVLPDGHLEDSTRTACALWCLAALVLHWSPSGACPCAHLGPTHAFETSLGNGRGTVIPHGSSAWLQLGPAGGTVKQATGQYFSNAHFRSLTDPFLIKQEVRDGVRDALESRVACLGASVSNPNGRSRCR